MLAPESSMKDLQHKEIETRSCKNFKYQERTRPPIENGTLENVSYEIW